MVADGAGFTSSKSTHYLDSLGLLLEAHTKTKVRTLYTVLKSQQLATTTINGLITQQVKYIIAPASRRRSWSAFINNVS
jgi:hypothetical protein